MKILFMLPRYHEGVNFSTLEKELVLEFKKQGHDTTLITFGDAKDPYFDVNGVRLIRINEGRYYDNKKGTSLFKKAIALLKSPFLIKRALNKYIKESPDLIIVSTPMANFGVISYLKNKYNTKVLSIIWDIFPQNAVDLGLIKNKYMIKFFKKSFHKALTKSDFIAVTSKGSKQYIESNFAIPDNKIEVINNWAVIEDSPKIDKVEIRKKYGLKSNDYIAVFGGNMGVPQRVENIIYLAMSIEQEDISTSGDIKFVFVGDGTEFNKLSNIFKDVPRIIFLNKLSRKDYKEFIAASDIGLVSLNEKFTVPNFPSKTTDYMKVGLPIFAILDNVSMNDYGHFLKNVSKAGIFSRAGDVIDCKENFLNLYKNIYLRSELGYNGRKYYEENLDVQIVYNKIMQLISF